MRRRRRGLVELLPFVPRVGHTLATALERNGNDGDRLGRAARRVRAASGAVACPLCSALVSGTAHKQGFIYTIEHAGPFGGPGTYFVAGGEEPPRGAHSMQSRMRAWPEGSFVELEPCGCRLSILGLSYYALTPWWRRVLSRGESQNHLGTFRITGDEYARP